MRAEVCLTVGPLTRLTRCAHLAPWPDDATDKLDNFSGSFFKPSRLISLPNGILDRAPSAYIQLAVSLLPIEDRTRALL